MKNNKSIDMCSLFCNSCTEYFIILNRETTNKDNYICWNCREKQWEFEDNSFNLNEVEEYCEY